MHGELERIKMKPACEVQNSADLICIHSALISLKAAWIHYFCYSSGLNSTANCTMTLIGHQPRRMKQENIRVSFPKTTIAT